MEDVLAIQLLELSQFIRRARQQWLRQRPDVPIGTVSILKLIDEIGGDGCHAKHLAERSGLDPSTVSRAVTAAVGQGLVVRHIDSADRRASALALTDAGRELLTAARTWFGDLVRRALADWPADDVTRVGGDIDRLLAALTGVLEKTHSQEAAR